MNAELRQANDLKDAFIKVASHELRTPLTIVLGLTDLARQTPGVAEPLQQWLEHIHTGGQRLNRLVDQMTKLLAAGRFERTLARKETCPGRPAARSRRMTWLLSSNTRHQTLTVDALPELGTMSVEPDKLRDSVDHLLLNAIKFTPDGGTIRLSGRRLADGGAEIEVKESGVGMDPASLDRFFQPFFTGFDVSRHRSGVFEFNRRGLGLGLSLVKAFVEMHGGRVVHQSKEGQGSTFTITLPAQPAPSPSTHQ